MVVIDRNFVRAFSPNEQLVMLRLLVEADSEGLVAYDEKKMCRWTQLSSEVVSEIYGKFLDDGVIVTKEDKTLICGFDGYQYQGKKKAKKREVITSNKPLSERQHEFGMSLTPFMVENGGKYPKEMIRAFYNYWSEPNQSQTKMRWELQKTWSVAGRLATWASNNKVFSSYNRDGQRINDIQRRQEGAAAIIARLAAEEGDDAQ